MKILVIGLGYIGLPTAVMFANYGQDVIGVDIKRETVTLLNRGEAHLEEPGLPEALRQAIQSGNFRAQTVVEPADTFIIAVPTPNKDDQYKSCDSSYVIQAVESILPYIQVGNTIIIESTIAPRTTEDVVKPMIERAGFEVGEDVFLAHCPERVLPGKILYELQYNNRIIGGITKKCSQKGIEIYNIFVKGELMKTSASIAEFSKLMENTYRDVNIALANELVQTAAALNIDGLEVIRFANKHPRVSIHQPGPGVGGHCLAVDPYFIVASSPKTTPLIQSARAINTTMPGYIVKQTKRLMEKISAKKITILGLTYKGNTSDIRESPALEVWQKLKLEGCYEIVAYDPYIKHDDVELDMHTAASNSDLLLILTDHDLFKKIDNTIIDKMHQKVVFDTKNIFPKDVEINCHINLGNLASLNNLPSSAPIN